MDSKINIDKINVYAYLAAFEDNALDELNSLELFVYLLNTNFIESLEAGYQNAAAELVKENYLVLKDNKFVINKGRITSLN